ncbi:MAG: uroporphyrinogen decarboxylase family protein [Alphaproteobacteria bacterium]|jgi:uroporphyrinogen decarboxylase|nr:uroporphyrinogen decarboxylase family protein [Alphaproteobacteria bacterium]
MAICRGERPGDVSLIDWFHRSWGDTIENWIAEGAPEEIRSQDAYNEYFQLDHLHALQEIVSEHNRLDLKDKDTQSLGFFHVTPPIMPVFEIEVLEEDERHRVETTFGGQTVQVSKEHPWRMPKYLDHPVKDWASWKDYKKRLDPETPERWPADWSAFVERTNARDAPTMLLMEGFFGVLREWTGLERLLFMFFDEPDLVEDMMDQVLHLDMGMAARATEDLRIDCVRFWEDMAYRSGPLISPDMFRKFMLPRYRTITDFLRSRGVEILHVDSDGDVTELIPLWLEVGINFPWPLEVAAGTDAIALRKEYGRDIVLSGNIDKRVFRDGKEAIKAEVMAKVPYLMESGPYFPCLDHAVPPDVSLEDFRYYINLLLEIGGRDKLPE